jgi:hypothetical protein
LRAVRNCASPPIFAIGDGLTIIAGDVKSTTCAAAWEISAVFGVFFGFLRVFT